MAVLNLLSIISPVCPLTRKRNESSLPSLHKPPFYIIQSSSLSCPGIVIFVFFKLKSPSVGSSVLNRNHSLCFIILFYLYLLSDLGNQSFKLFSRCGHTTDIHKDVTTFSAPFCLPFLIIPGVFDLELDINFPQNYL